MLDMKSHLQDHELKVIGKHVWEDEVVSIWRNCVADKEAQMSASFLFQKVAVL